MLLPLMFRIVSLSPFLIIISAIFDLFPTIYILFSRKREFFINYITKV
jgi:hypothetical protein